MELQNGTHLIRCPIPSGHPSEINLYLLESRGGVLLIDTGWDCEESYSALVDGLAEAGAAMGDITHVVLTHSHPDHVGLVGRILDECDAQAFISRPEFDQMRRRGKSADSFCDAVDEMIRLSGSPPSLAVSPDGRPTNLCREGSGNADDPVISDETRVTLVEGGDEIPFGDRSLRVILTPGHSPGHICLYEEASGLMFSGDHVFGDRSATLWSDEGDLGRSVVEHIASLNRIADLPAERVLPAHGKPFTNLKERCDGNASNHRCRLDHLKSLCRGRWMTGYECAQEVAWHTPWAEIGSDEQRRAVVSQTVSYLEALVLTEEVQRKHVDGVYLYRSTCAGRKGSLL